MTLYDRLRAEKKCPACGQDKSSSSDFESKMQMVKFKCGASFGVSGITGKIEVYEPCPTPSLIQASHMMLEFEAEQARRNAVKAVG